MSGLRQERTGERSGLPALASPEAGRRDLRWFMVSYFVLIDCTFNLALSVLLYSRVSKAS
jgi:hypothetical protein